MTVAGQKKKTKYFNADNRQPDKGERRPGASSKGSDSNAAVVAARFSVYDYEPDIGWYEVDNTPIRKRNARQEAEREAKKKRPRVSDYEAAANLEWLITNFYGFESIEEAMKNASPFCPVLIYTLPPTEIAPGVVIGGKKPGQKRYDWLNLRFDVRAVRAGVSRAAGTQYVIDPKTSKWEHGNIIAYRPPLDELLNTDQWAIDYYWKFENWYRVKAWGWHPLDSPYGMAFYFEAEPYVAQPTVVEKEDKEDGSK
jgi:hypothetical protein